MKPMTPLERVRREALGNLCIYDPRSLLYSEPDPDDNRKPRNGCCCDKCFYGKDRMATAILDFLETL